MRVVLKSTDRGSKRSNVQGCALLMTVFILIQANICAEGAQVADLSAAILRSMNSKVKPCDNFYEFACGNFADKVPANKDSVSVFNKIGEKVEAQLTDIITDEKNGKLASFAKLPSDFYKACINEPLIESLGTAPIAKIAKSLGEWPVVVGASWDANKSWSWQKTIQDFRRLGFPSDYLINFIVTKDAKNDKKYIIWLDQAATNLDLAFLTKGFKDSTVSAYYNYMVDIAVRFGAKKEVAQKELKDSLQFEIELAKISSPPEKRLDAEKLYNLRSIKQLQASYPYVKWLEYINAFLPAGTKVDENENVNLVYPGYFDNLAKLLQTTNKRAIANYLIWSIHEFSINYLTKDLRKRKHEYNKVLLGTEEQDPRPKECVKHIFYNDPLNPFKDFPLQNAVSSLYVRKYFKPELKAAALKIFNDIKTEFSQLVEQQKWMDPKTKKEAVRKIKLLTPYIAYPDEILDNKIIEKYYSNLQIIPDKFFESALNLNRFSVDLSYGKLKTPYNKGDWQDHSRAADVNIFYNPFDNSFQLFAGLLQENILNEQYPDSLKYGALGSLIGSMIATTLSQVGRSYDADGKLVNWWQPETDKAFLNRSKCIIDQYSKYTDKETGLSLNGEKTQMSNIGDNIGVKISYLAYSKVAGSNAKVPKLPGLNYTPQQLFWIANAQVWCTKYKKEFLKTTIVTSVVSPAEFRVLGSLQNSEAFSTDFKCPKGSPMNPKQKCVVY